jgi:hypothetical protein
MLFFFEVSYKNISPARHRAVGSQTKEIPLTPRRKGPRGGAQVQHFGEKDHG